MVEPDGPVTYRELVDYVDRTAVKPMSEHSEWHVRTLETSLKLARASGRQSFAAIVAAVMALAAIITSVVSLRGAR